ncbi:MAG: hypothetical protein RSA54_10900, partial [Glutamicibacter sp.]
RSRAAKKRSRQSSFEHFAEAHRWHGNAQARDDFPGSIVTAIRYASLASDFHHRRYLAHPARQSCPGLDVSMALPLDATGELGEFFAQFMTESPVTA